MLVHVISAVSWKLKDLSRYRIVTCTVNVVISETVQGRYAVSALSQPRKFWQTFNNLFGSNADGKCRTDCPSAQQLLDFLMRK